jgi:hypothetical protein
MSKDFETVDLVAERLSAVHKKYAPKKADFNSDYDELTETFQGVVTMLDAYEILECHYDDQIQHIVAHHKLKECVFGFDAVHSDNYEESNYYIFDNAKEAFGMIAEILTL